MSGNCNKIVQIAYQPSSLRRYSLSAVSELLCCINEKVDSLSPWLGRGQILFNQLPYDLIEEIIEDFKSHLAHKWPPVVRQELFHLLYCKPLKKVTLDSFIMKTDDVLPVMKIIADTQSDVQCLKIQVMNPEFRSISWFAIPQSLEFLKDYIRVLPSLQFLNVSFACDDEMLDIIGVSCPNLTVLYAASLKITNEGLKSLCMNTKKPEDTLRRCQRLQILGLYTLATNLKDGIKELLVRLPRLQRLICWHLDFKEAVTELVEDMEKMPQFNLLTFFYTGGPHYSPIPSLLPRMCPNLMRLCLMDPTEEELQRFVYIDRLRFLEIIGNETTHNFNDGIASLLKKIGRNLASLHLFAVIGISFSSISENCANLKELQATNCSVMTETPSSDSPIFKTIHVLRLLSKDGAVWQPDECIELISNCWNLRFLRLNLCPDLTSEHLREIVTKNPLSNMVHVYIDSNNLHLQGGREEWMKLCSDE